jgi:hypothetical protein
MAKVDKVVVQIEDDVLKMLLSKISDLQLQIVQIQSELGVMRAEQR